MTTMASQITSLTVVYSAVYSDADQRKHQSSASLAFVQGIHRWPVNSPHKGPVTRKMFPFDDVIMHSNDGPLYRRNPNGTPLHLQMFNNSGFPPTKGQSWGKCSCHDDIISLKIHMFSLLEVLTLNGAPVDTVYWCSIRGMKFLALSLIFCNTPLIYPYIYLTCYSDTVGCNYLSLPLIPASAQHPWYTRIFI